MLVCVDGKGASKLTLYNFHLSLNFIVGCRNASEYFEILGNPWDGYTVG